MTLVQIPSTITFSIPPSARLRLTRSGAHNLAFETAGASGSMTATTVETPLQFQVYSASPEELQLLYDCFSSDHAYNGVLPTPNAINVDPGSSADSKGEAKELEGLDRDEGSEKAAGDEGCSENEGPLDDDDAEVEEKRFEKKRKGVFKPPPTLESARRALSELDLLIKPHRKCGYGYADPDLDKHLLERLKNTRLFCWNYIDLAEKANKCDDRRGIWGAAALQTAKSFGK